MLDGFRIGIEQMVVGERRRLWVPENQAYGQRRDRPAGALVIDVDLLAILEAPVTIPSDIGQPPQNAETTRSGLRMLLLRRGGGTYHPTPQNIVTIHYSAWTRDGELFDSSVIRGAALTARVENLPRGVAEAVQLMVAGERRRLWVPEGLAYGTASEPHGALVFDLELVEAEPAAQPVRNPGTVEITTNMPDFAYIVIRPDLSRFGWRGPHSFIEQPPGQYGIVPDVVDGLNSFVDAAPPDMALLPGQTLKITITYKPQP
jgi:FKBP-type peptidyl-prolyl cis-trans isomerase